MYKHPTKVANRKLCKNKVLKIKRKTGITYSLYLRKILASMIQLIATQKTL